MTTGADEFKFLQIFLMNNPSQLRLILEKYEKLTGYTIEKAIDKLFCENLKDAFLVIGQYKNHPSRMIIIEYLVSLLILNAVKSTQDRAGFFVERLHSSVEGKRKDYDSFIRIIVTHCETDLEDIKIKYMSKHKMALSDCIQVSVVGQLNNFHYAQSFYCLQKYIFENSSRCLLSLVG